MRLRSAGAVAAVLEDALLEEGTELADIVFGEVGVAVGSERRAGGRQHHPEQVPQVALRQNNTMKDRRITARARRRIWVLSGTGTAALPPGDCGARPPSAHHGFQKVSLEGTRELPAGEERKSSGTLVDKWVMVDSVVWIFLSNNKIFCDSK